MPTVQHDAVMYLMSRNPDFGAALLEYVAEIDVPSYHVAVWSGADLSQPVPAPPRSGAPPGEVRVHAARSTLYRPDTVVCLRDLAKEPLMAIVAETQRRPDRVKRYT